MVSASRSGEVLIKFSNDMIVPQFAHPGSSDHQRMLDSSYEEINIGTVLKTEGMLEAELIRDSFSDDADSSGLFEWHVDDFTEKSLKVKLEFEQPETISTAGDDYLRLSFKNTTLLFDWMGHELSNDTVLEYLLPPQYASETERKIFTALEDSVKSKETGSFHSDVVVNALIAGSLQSVWSLVSSQQIIILVPLFYIRLPASSQAVFSVLL